LKRKEFVMPEEKHPQPEATPEIPAPPTTREADVGDAPPPPAVEGKGLLGQSVPDVATGSTPATRHDD
jgi:hypothetical protein